MVRAFGGRHQPTIIRQRDRDKEREGKNIEQRALSSFTTVARPRAAQHPAGILAEPQYSHEQRGL